MRYRLGGTGVAGLLAIAALIVPGPSAGQVPVLDGESGEPESVRRSPTPGP